MKSLFATVVTMMLISELNADRLITGMYGTADLNNCRIYFTETYNMDEASDASPLVLSFNEFESVALITFTGGEPAYSINGENGRIYRFKQRAVILYIKGQPGFVILRDEYPLGMSDRATIIQYIKSELSDDIEAIRKRESRTGDK